MHKASGILLGREGSDHAITISVKEFLGIHIRLPIYQYNI